VTIRDRIVSAAHEVEGLRAATDEPAFRSLLGEPPKGSKWDLSQPFSCRKVDGKCQTKGVSTCGLVAVGILRRAGLKLPFVGPYWQWPRYEGLDVVSALSKLGTVTESRRPAGAMPMPGDVCCIGSSLATHVFTVVDWDGATMISVDGGQVDDAAHRYLQRVKVCRRVWPRPVVWVIDSETLWANLEAVDAYP